ncbi:hypothetical protein CFP56_032178 [Quercus suber]|uniref:Uncharacterized protein n=1 Tax=Quercus suber TaxID=58331 RepID=A0AAW0JHH0_QUESU
MVSLRQWLWLLWIYNHRRQGTTTSYNEDGFFTMH